MANPFSIILSKKPKAASATGGSSAGNKKETFRSILLKPITNKIKTAANVVKKGQETVFGKGVVNDVYDKAGQVVKSVGQDLKTKITTPQPQKPLKEQFKETLIKKPANIFKDIISGVAYGASYLGKSAIKAAGGDKALETVNNPELEKKLYGKPVSTLQDFSKKAGKYAEEKGSNKFQKAATQGAAIVGSLFVENPLDFAAAPAKAALKNLAKETSEDLIKAELKNTFKNMADDVIADVAPRIAKTTDEAEVKAILESASQPKKEVEKIMSSENLENGLTPSQANTIRKEVKEVDRLIAEGKIRVVSRDNRDVYQTKKGDEWITARDEDSAVKRFGPRKEPAVPEKFAERKNQIDEQLAFQKETLETHPGKDLKKLVSKKEGVFLDEKSPDLGQTPAERQKIIEQNKKRAQKAESALENTPDYDKYNDPDFIRSKIDDYEKKFADMKTTRAEKRELQKLMVEERKRLRNAEAEARARGASLSRAEAKSIEDQAEEARGLLDEPIREKVKPLDEIVESIPTDVKRKINLLDYLRTPEYVLKKIGFGREAKALRKGYEDYIQELPKNIDKITAWSKRVDKDANQKIFKFLDGQDVVLNAEEKKVAEEIQAYLKEWADRLGLPEDNRIAQYITHIFDDQLIQKEFDEDLAKIIADKLPGQVYDPFLEQRLGAKGYIEDTWRALDAYTKRATRKVHMDPALDMMKTKAGSSLEMANIEKSQWKYLQNYINNINMRPTWADELIDNAIKASFLGYKFGARPITRMLKTLRQWTFRGALGLNPGSALRNLSQGANTFAMLGPVHTTAGYLKLFSPKSIKELKALGIFDSGFIQDRSISATKKLMEKVDKGLFVFFDTAEKINRGAAYFGAKSRALAQGKTVEQAIEEGKKMVRKTQFNFAPIDNPVALQNDIMKTLFQFQTYTTKQVEFLGGLVKDRNFLALARYGLAGMAFVYTVGQAFGMDVDELIPQYRIGTPASLKLPVEIGKAALDAPDKFGNDRSTMQKLEDIGKSGIMLLPAGIQAQKTLRGIQAVELGGSYNKADKQKFAIEDTGAAKTQAIVFGPYSSKNAEEYFNREKTLAKEEKAIAPIYERIQAFKAEGDADGAIALFKELTPAEQETYARYKQKTKTAQTLQGKKDIVPKYQEIRALVAEGRDAEAIEAYKALTADEKRYYGLVKKQIEEDEKAAEGATPEFAEGEPQTPETVLNTVGTYAKAIGVDPVTAFNRIFTGQKIRYVMSGAIVVERLPVEKSQQIKEEREGNNPGMKLDHTVPLQLGGSNAESNLVLVPTEVWETYTPVENAIGKALRDKKIRKNEAQRLIKAFKNGELTAEEVYKQL